MTENLDRKYFGIMLDLIIKYKHGKINLRKLIDDLEGLVNLLELVEKKHKEELQSLWGVLEDLYADMLYEKNKELEIDDDLAIESSLDKIEALINRINK